MPQPPFHRNGVRFTNSPQKNLPYFQLQCTGNADFAYRGELFLNEALEEIYYVDSARLAHKFSANGTPAAWGAITGTLASQLDLKTALDLKTNTTDFISALATKLNVSKITVGTTPPLSPAINDLWISTD